MKKKLFFVFLFSVLNIFSQNNKQGSIYSTSNKVTIKIGDKNEIQNWIISPKMKPDILRVPLNENEIKKVIFYTNIDSIQFEVKSNFKYDFNIILNNKDTCWTQINTYKGFSFNEEYIKSNKGKYSFEIPELQELILIICTITEIGQKSEYFFNKRSDYFKKVLKKFKKYSNEPIVKKINTILREGNYNSLKMDACGFYFDGNLIVKDKTYDNLSWNGNNYIDELIKDLEDFSIKTDFRFFFKSNKTYYDNEIELIKKMIDIKSQWDWLENKYKILYDHYRITFSPLVGGSHSTNNFIQNNFKQSVMFICGPIDHFLLGKKTVKGIMSRIIFTEISHNYNNPISEKYLDKIKNSFKIKNKWCSKKTLSNYNSELLIFNEYMTFGLFTLYCFDNLPPNDFKKINSMHVKFMKNKRGFKLFKKFNKELLNLYKNNEQNFESIYPLIIDWCSKT